jgi:hypothetical protein
MALWKAAHFTAAQLDAGAADDLSSATGDGVPNLLKYAYGLSPFDDASSLGPVLQLVDGSILLQYRQRSAAKDLRFDVEISSDLKNWTSGVGLWEEIAREQVGPGIDLVSIRELSTLSLSQPRFLRLNVTRQITDTTGVGLPDDWQIRHFGLLGVGPDGDPDGDSLSNRTEMLSASDPHDCYDGHDLVVKPLLTPAGQLLPGGVMRVWVGRSDGRPLRSAEVNFKILAGENMLIGDSGTTLEVTVRTNAQGIAEVRLAGGGC